MGHGGVTPGALYEKSAVCPEEKYEKGVPDAVSHLSILRENDNSDYERYLRVPSVIRVDRHLGEQPLALQILGRIDES
jgi:hypothetical protein